MNPTVYELSGKSIKPVYRFDFGILNVPDEYFEYGDAFAATESLFSRQFISILRFMENDKYAVVQGLVNNEEIQRSIIGIKDKKESGKWYWFDSVPEKENSLFYMAVVALTDKSELYFLIDPGKIMTMNDSLKKSLFQNAEFKNIDESDNYILLILQLK